MEISQTMAQSLNMLQFVSTLRNILSPWIDSSKLTSLQCFIVQINVLAQIDSLIW
jgi:hypothetical protein